MKWLVIPCLLVCLARRGAGGAIRCTPDSTDPSCSPERNEQGPPIEVSKDDSQNVISAAVLACDPGLEWQTNCLQCRCSKSGQAECERKKNCDRPEENDDFLYTPSNPSECKPNSTIKMDCRTCVCLQNGLGLCTLEDCFTPSTVPKKSSLSSGKQCAPGTSWRSQCNACVCTSTGYAFCEELPCIEHESERVMKCAPNSQWKNDCNTCRCTTDGRAMCTKMGCDVAITDQESTEKTDNNVPTLRRERASLTKLMKFSLHVPNHASLTRKIRSSNVEKDAKGLSRKVRAFQPSETPKAAKTCQPGQEFRMDCNKCLCDNEGQDFSCTRIDCSAVNNNHASAFTTTRRRREVAELANKCVPGSVFNHDCNVCRCTEDGLHAACTLKLCFKSTDPKQEPIVTVTESDPGFRCNPGEQFNRDCKDCMCSADGKSIFCTVRLCDQDLAPGI